MVETQGGEPGDGAAEVLDRPLPDGVRRRVVHIVSEGFGGLTVGELPAQLRQYARFAPNRRAQFAGNALAGALGTDPLSRQRIGEKFREAQPELAGALDSGAPPPAADPLDVAAAAYVLRPTGWVQLGTAAGGAGPRAGARRGAPGGGRRAGRRGEPGRAGAAARGAHRRPRPDARRDRAVAHRPGV